MKKINFNIAWLFVFIIILIMLFLKGDNAFYALIVAVIVILPFFIIRVIKTFKENPQKKKL